MAEFENKELGVKFTVPEELSLRDELAYYSGVDPSQPWMVSMWQSALVLIRDWECKEIPNPHQLDLDKRQKRQVFQIVTWAGAQVSSHVNRLGVPDPKA